MPDQSPYFRARAISRSASRSGRRRANQAAGKNSPGLTGKSSSGMVRPERTSEKAATAGREYKVPHGGLFEYCSAGNMAAEILEWCGFALAAWSLVSFFLQGGSGAISPEFRPRQVAVGGVRKKTIILR